MARMKFAVALGLLGGLVAAVWLAAMSLLSVPPHDAAANDPRLLMEMLAEDAALPGMLAAAVMFVAGILIPLRG